MNAKSIVLGGLAFYVVTWILSFVTGPVIHDGVLLESYKATAGFWRPALMQEPPDMAALLPRWITTGLIYSFVLAALYSKVRPVFAGSGWMRGARFGFWIWLFATAIALTYSGFFNLPDRIWFWWAIDGLVGSVIGCAVLAWTADRWAPARH
jgi:hypothetical protein